jgi:hypothetical protein
MLHEGLATPGNGNSQKNVPWDIAQMVDYY